MIQARLKARWDTRTLKSKLNSPVRFAGRGFFASSCRPPWIAICHVGQERKLAWMATCHVGQERKLAWMAICHVGQERKLAWMAICHVGQVTGMVAAT